MSLQSTTSVDRSPSVSAQGIDKTEKTKQPAQVKDTLTSASEPLADNKPAQSFGAKIQACFMAIWQWICDVICCRSCRKDASVNSAEESSQKQANATDASRKIEKNADRNKAVVEQFKAEAQKIAVKQKSENAALLSELEQFVKMSQDASDAEIRQNLAKLRNSTSVGHFPFLSSFESLGRDEFLNRLGSYIKATKWATDYLTDSDSIELTLFMDRAKDDKNGFTRDEAEAIFNSLSRSNQGELELHYNVATQGLDGADQFLSEFPIVRDKNDDRYINWQRSRSKIYHFIIKGMDMDIRSDRRDKITAKMSEFGLTDRDVLPKKLNLQLD